MSVEYNLYYFICFPNAVRLSQALDQPFNLKPLNCPPSLHGYVPSCSNLSITFAIWEVQLYDLLERPIFLSFYVHLGYVYPLKVRNILRCRPLNGQVKSISLPCSTYSPYILPTYHDAPTFSSPRTYLYISLLTSMQCVLFYLIVLLSVLPS